MIAIIGGGASGLLVAANLPKGAPHVLFEPGELGGAAYSTHESVHLLNVRAARMSAFADQPDHFSQWAGLRGDEFAPRQQYAAYLKSLVDLAKVVPKRVEAIVGSTVRLADGSSFEAERIVLALGHVVSEGPEHPAWAPLPDAALAAEQIVILGTGLTCVDVVLTLNARGYRGEVHAVSRHGWLPQVHEPQAVQPRALREGRFTTAREVFHVVREHLANGGSWQSGVDGVRPRVAAIWQALPLREKARLLRHANTLWDIHRHRLASELNEVVQRWRAQKRLVLHRGRIVERSARSVKVKRHGSITTLSGFAVNALGPARAHHPVVKQLIAEGRAVEGTLGFGVKTSASGALIDSRGVPSETLFTLGPLRRGDLWETTAIGEIRAQAKALVGALIETSEHRVISF